jgi:uncharacterized surface protein with fasciclin (FAS1) repeats
MNSNILKTVAAICFAFILGESANAQWAYTLDDAMNGIMYVNDSVPEPCCFNSGYMFQQLNNEQLDDEDSEYTIFVPNQEAVEEVMALMNLNQWDLAGFSDLPTALNYHIVTGTYMAADLTDGMSLPTLQGQSLSVSVGAGVMINDANVIQTDITADNGVIHVIDKTMAPSGYPEATVVTAIAQSEAHTAFTSGIINAYLVEYLSAQALEAEDDTNGDPLPGPYTVFAPSDDAVNAFALSIGYSDAIAFINSQNVDEFVERHIVVGVYESSDLSDGQVLTTLSGETIEIGLGDAGATASGAAIEVVDILAYNGVVHSLAEVLPLDVPVVEGTCGTWTINLFNADAYEDWGGSTVDVYVDGMMISSETNNELATDADFDGFPEELGTSTFSFAANEGSVIDVIFTDTNGSGWPSYEVVDENGNVLFETVDDTNFGAGSVFGLKPCDTDFSCGYVEILFVDESQEGWFGGALEVFSYEYGMYATIDFNPFGTYAPSFQSFWQRKAFVPVNTGEIGFAVMEPVINAEACGYLVFGPSGELLVDQSSEFIAPQSVEGIEACAEGDDAQCNATFDVSQATTPNGTPIAGAVNITIYDYNINASYAWDFGDEGTSDEPFTSWQYITDGPYNLCLTVTDDAAGCSDTYCEAISVDSLGLLDGFLAGFLITVIDGGESGSTNAVGELNEFFAEAIVYPNPATDWLAISGLEPNLIWKASLVSLTGQAVREFSGTGVSQMNVAGIPSGLYLLQMIGENTAAKTLRVVID